MDYFPIIALVAIAPAAVAAWIASTSRASDRPAESRTWRRIALCNCLLFVELVLNLRLQIPAMKDRIIGMTISPYAIEQTKAGYDLVVMAIAALVSLRLLTGSSSLRLGLARSATACTIALCALEFLNFALLGKLLGHHFGPMSFASWLRILGGWTTVACAIWSMRVQDGKA